MKRNRTQISLTDVYLSGRKLNMEFFDRINSVIDWKEVNKIIKQNYSKGKSTKGRKAYSGLLLFKICLLKVWYNLSDYQVVEYVNDSLSLMKFLNLKIHKKGTYICVEGRRFSTRAESKLWRIMKADIIGMTLVPEAVLAREKEMCYLSISSVTDYDCWSGQEAVSADDVARTMKKNTENVKKILSRLIPALPRERRCNCSKALEGAFI